MSLIPTVNVLVGSNLPSQRLLDIAFALGPSPDDCWLDFAFITEWYLRDTLWSLLRRPDPGNPHGSEQGLHHKIVSGPGPSRLVDWRGASQKTPWICSGGTGHEHDNHVRLTCRSGPYPNPQGYPQYQQAAPVPQPQVPQPSQQRQTQKG